MSQFVKFNGGILYPYTPPLARSGTLADGLVFFAALTEQSELGSFDAVSGIHASAGIIHAGSGPSGYGRYDTSNGGFTYGFFDRYKLTTGGFTTAVYGCLDTDAVSAFTLLNNSSGAIRTNQWRLIANFNGSVVTSGSMTFWTTDGTSSFVQASSVIDPTKPHWYIGVRHGGGGSVAHQLWRDQVLQAESSLTARDVSGANTDSLKHGLATGEMARGRSITRTALWNRALTPPEIAELVLNPSALSAKRKFQIKLPAASSSFFNPMSGRGGTAAQPLVH